MVVEEGILSPPKIAWELEMKILCSEGENDRFCKCLNSFNESDPQHVGTGILKNLQQLTALQADSDVSMLRVTQFVNVPAKKTDHPTWGLVLLGPTHMIMSISSWSSAHLSGSDGWLYPVIAAVLPSKG